MARIIRLIFLLLALLSVACERRALTAPSTATMQRSNEPTMLFTRAEISGIDASGIAEVADLNNDGLLDLVFAADPDNSGGPYGGDKKRYEDKVFINTGALGGGENHWLHLRFSGISDAELIGARVEARDANGKLLGMRVIASNHSYKSGGALDAHFGLGKNTRADLTITLLNKKAYTFPNVPLDRFLEVDLVNNATRFVQVS